MIDVHTHFLPIDLEDFNKKFNSDQYVRLVPCGTCKARMERGDGTVFREVEHHLWDLSARRAEAKSWGVSRQVLSTVPVMFSYQMPPLERRVVAQSLNDGIAKAADFDKTFFSSLGTLPLPDVAASLEEIERAKSLGLVGFQVGTHFPSKDGDLELYDPRLIPVWEALERHSLCLFIHPWDMLAPERMKKFWFPWLVGMPTETALAISGWIFSGMSQRFSQLRIGFAHAGGSFAQIAGRLKAGQKARPDLTMLEGGGDPFVEARKLYVDSLAHDTRALQSALHVFGRDRVMLGTDYPFPLGDRSPRLTLQELGVDEASLLLLAERNAKTFLGVD